MGRYAVLLRGINVGRANRIGMADLRKLLAGEGYQNVATLLQSGNIVLDTPAGGDELARGVERAIRERFEIAIDVVVRSQDELEQVLAKDPLREVAEDDSRYMVSFLAEPPGPAVTDTLAAAELGDERYCVDGRELYVWCPGGVRDSPLLAALSKAKGHKPVTTTRNWNTVRKLAAML